MAKKWQAEVPTEEVEQEIVLNVESTDLVSDSDNTVQEETIEEVPVEENQQSSVDDDIAGGGPKNPDPKNKSTVEESTTVINDGTDGNAGQEFINDIEVDFEE